MSPKSWAPTNICVWLQQGVAVGTRDHVVPADRINAPSFPSRGSLRLLIKRALGPELEDLSRSKLVQLIPSFTSSRVLSPVDDDGLHRNHSPVDTRLSNDHQGCIVRLPTPRACRTDQPARHGSIRRGTAVDAWRKNAAAAAAAAAERSPAASKRGVAVKPVPARLCRTVGAGSCAAEAGGGLRPQSAIERFMATQWQAGPRPRTAAAGPARGVSGRARSRDTGWHAGPLALAGLQSPSQPPPAINMPMSSSRLPFPMPLSGPRPYSVTLLTPSFVEYPRFSPSHLQICSYRPILTSRSS